MPKQVPFWQAVPPLPLSRSGALDSVDFLVAYNCSLVRILLSPEIVYKKKIEKCLRPKTNEIPHYREARNDKSY